MHTRLHVPGLHSCSRIHHFVPGHVSHWSWGLRWVREDEIFNKNDEAVLIITIEGRGGAQVMEICLIMKISHISSERLKQHVVYRAM
jgi:hypothetical protein